MPSNLSAAKRHRQNDKRRTRNRAARSRIHSLKRSFLDALEQNDKGVAEESFKEISKLIDSAANKGIYHRRTADRKKSRFHKILNQMTAE